MKSKKKNIDNYADHLPEADGPWTDVAGVIKERQDINKANWASDFGNLQYVIWRQGFTNNTKIIHLKKKYV